MIFWKNQQNRKAKKEAKKPEENTKNKQIIKNHANHYSNKNVLIPKITLDPNLRLFTVRPSK